jgi:regulator of protease activity HflC (stomatin/prohibitin superfamily)
MNRALILAVVAIFGLIVAASTLFTVHQTQQVLVTQFGQPIRVIREPGLHVKIPFIQSVIAFDRRLLDYEGTPEEVILGDQRRLNVDSFTRYQITDPLLFFQTAGATEVGIRGRLNAIVTSAVRRVLGNEPLNNVLSNDRARITAEIRRQVNDEARRFGIEVVDVRIRRADLPEQNTQAILQRMQSERERVAREERARGAQEAQGASVPCCWPRPRSSRTSCAARASRNRSGSSPTPSSATRTSSSSGARCRPTARPSARATPACCSRPTASSSASSAGTSRSARLRVALSRHRLLRRPRQRVP